MHFDKGIVTGHFIAHWGVPNDIIPRKLTGIGEFAILEFAPRGRRTTWRYASNGMSSYAQTYSDGLATIRTELYGVTGGKALWVCDLLAAIATYPVDFKTYLTEGDTIKVGQPIDRHGSRFTAVMLARPGLGDPETLGIMGRMPEGVFVQQVVGIWPSEAAFAEEHGGKSLWRRLANMGDLSLDEDRVPVI
jgi:hypothetical protein